MKRIIALAAIAALVPAGLASADTTGGRELKNMEHYELRDGRQSFTSSATVTVPVEGAGESRSMENYPTATSVERPALRQPPIAPQPIPRNSME